MEGIELIRHVYALFGRGDIPNLVALFDPRIEWRQAEGNPVEPSGTPWLGPDEITEKLFNQIGANWDGFTITPHRFHEAGGTVVVEGRYTGVFKATGRHMDAQMCHRVDAAGRQGRGLPAIRRHRAAAMGDGERNRRASSGG